MVLVLLLYLWRLTGLLLLFKLGYTALVLTKSFFTSASFQLVS